MNCNHMRTMTRNRGFRADRLDPASREHLATCELCRVWFSDEVLRVALVTAPVPEPEAGFIDRALAGAVTARAARRLVPAWAAAAGVIIAVAGLLTVALGVREIPLNEHADRPAEPRMVNVVINASERRRDATLTIRLAEDLELEGYAGLHTIEWQTDLEQGRNLLSLPVRSKSGGGGEIWIALSYRGATAKEMRIQVDAG
jgi:hypothetical protein